LLAYGWWFSPGTLASPTTKTGHHDIADIAESGIKHKKFKFICWGLLLNLGQNQ
jgi:hypothetical protein